MLKSPLDLTLGNADATARLGAAIGPRLRPGDTVLLQGPVGAGKTHFARALLQAILLVPEDVPSPTFTLVQTYDTRNGPLWHVDLYRITTDTEIDEIGLFDAFEEAICLVEWPDRLGTYAPADALTISLKPKDDTRTAHLTWTNARWDALLTEVLAHDG
ncbi:MAG: tRNA (adenosine(37)-N6)-threonylcarbamoyltransferase complex ATPase subunit type 1 TsaE [Pseudomonadota bacterium]